MSIGWLIAGAYAAFLLLAVVGWMRLGPRLRDYPPRASGPRVSVIVPARNEALNIQRCVRSLLATAYQAAEVVVVDDQSTDGTGDIVERLARSPEARGRLRLVRGAATPAGWFGKAWAVLQGYREASGELLLFTDADTDHAPELLPRAVAALEAERAHLVSVLAFQETEGFWERLVQPQVFLALGARLGDLRRINRTRVDWDAVAAGQFILTTREAYERVGTHQAVKDFVAEDLALAQTYVRHGLDIFLVHAPEYMRTRMYRSLREILEGWTKNLALAVPLTFPPKRALRAVAPWLMWVPALAWILPPVLWALNGWTWAGAATAISLVTWAAVYRAQGVPVRYALLYPLGAAMVAYMMIRSALRGSRVEWRGREYGRLDA